MSARLIIWITVYCNHPYIRTDQTNLSSSTNQICKGNSFWHSFRMNWKLQNTLLVRRALKRGRGGERTQCDESFHGDVSERCRRPGARIMLVDKFLWWDSETAGPLWVIFWAVVSFAAVGLHTHTHKQIYEAGERSEESRWSSSLKSLHYRNTRTRGSTDSFGGLVYSYLSNYSSFPRAPAKGAC